MTSIMDGASGPIVGEIIRVAFPDARSVLDVTFGKGMFWRGWTPPEHLNVYVSDINPPKELPKGVDPRVCLLPNPADFTDLPGLDYLYDVVIFDPPYQTEMGKGKSSIMGGRFGTFAKPKEMESTVRKGAAEAWRVANLGVIIKVQNHIHNNRLLHMTRWIQESIPADLYDEVHVQKPGRGKVIDPKWDTTDRLSAYRVHSTFLIFRRDSVLHRRRRLSRQ